MVNDSIIRTGEGLQVTVLSTERRESVVIRTFSGYTGVLYSSKLLTTLLSRGFSVPRGRAGMQAYAGIAVSCNRPQQHFNAGTLRVTEMNQTGIFGSTYHTIRLGIATQSLSQS